MKEIQSPRSRSRHADYVILCVATYMLRAAGSRSSAPAWAQYTIFVSTKCVDRWFAHMRMRRAAGSCGCKAHLLLQIVLLYSRIPNSVLVHLRVARCRLLRLGASLGGSSTMRSYLLLSAAAACINFMMSSCTNVAAPSSRPLSAALRRASSTAGTEESTPVPERVV